MRNPHRRVRLLLAQIKDVLSSVLQTGLSGLKAGSLGDEAGTQLLRDDDNSTENQLQAALEQTLLKNIQYKVRYVCRSIVTVANILRYMHPRADERHDNPPPR